MENLEEDITYAEPVIFEGCPYNLEGTKINLGGKVSCTGFPDLEDITRDGECLLCEYLMDSERPKK